MKWEYHRLRHGGIDIKTFNKLGEEGWELIHTEYLTDGFRIYLFKRPSRRIGSISGDAG